MMKKWNWDGVALKDRIAIFVDFDHLLFFGCNTQTNLETPLLEEERRLEGDATQFHKPLSALLTVIDSQKNREFFHDLDNLRCGNRGLILFSKLFHGLTKDQMESLFKQIGIEVEDVLEAGNAQERADAAAQYLADSYDSILKYVVLDTQDIGTLHPKLKGHVFIMQQGERISYDKEQEIDRILEYGPWWGIQYNITTAPRELQGRLIEKFFDKIIFLDIDGVLNDDGLGRKMQTINPDFVSNLAKIVKSTGAAIILSSSWRGAVKSYLNYGGNCPDVELLLKLLKENDIEISGCTPDLMSGPNGRPYEIRAWLTNRPGITNFVILDDETFWNWGWLKAHVVCTRKESESFKVPDICGLIEEYAEQAIRILNSECKN